MLRFHSSVGEALLTHIYRGRPLGGTEAALSLLQLDSSHAYGTGWCLAARERKGKRKLCASLRVAQQPTVALVSSAAPRVKGQTEVKRDVKAAIRPAMADNLSEK